MTVDERSNGSVIVSERWTLLRWGSITTGVLMGVILLVVRIAGTTKDPVMLLPAAGVSLLAMVLGVVIPDRRFAFEPALGRFRWSVRRLAFRQGETLALTDIHDVELDVRNTTGGTPRESYRVILITSQGPMSLTSGRELDGDVCGRLADRIWAMSSAGSGTAAPAPPEDQENAA